MTTLESLNPATGEVVGAVDVTAPDSVPELVERARRAQPEWAAIGVEERCRLLAVAGESMTSRVDELAQLLTAEMGKPLDKALSEVRICSRELSQAASEFPPALMPEVVEDRHTRSTLYHDPLGVAAAITPWNFPLLMPNWMALPALAAGNTVVLKPSEETPLIAHSYVDLLAQHLPADVIQIAHGADDQGRALVVAEVDLVAFTGSREVGKKIMRAAADRLTRLVLELGGKDPLIVLDSADVDAAARFAATNSFSNCGQVCVSTERILVASSIAQQFVDRLVAATAELAVGPGTDPDVDIGPMINARQRDHVLAQIDDAVARGATIAHGGSGHHDNFVMPTVLTGITDEMDIAIRETFGPVACVTRVDSAEEAIERANSGRFGLGAVVFGAEEEARAVARRIQAGVIGINKGVHGARGTPWVGARESGYAFHGSPAGHRNFTQCRVVSTPRR